MTCSAREELTKNVIPPCWKEVRGTLRRDVVVNQLDDLLGHLYANDRALQGHSFRQGVIQRNEGIGNDGVSRSAVLGKRWSEEKHPDM